MIKSKIAVILLSLVVLAIFTMPTFAQANSAIAITDGMVTSDNL